MESQVIKENDVLYMKKTVKTSKVTNTGDAMHSKPMHSAFEDINSRRHVEFLILHTPILSHCL